MGGGRSFICSGRGICLEHSGGFVFDMDMVGDGRKKDKVDRASLPDSERKKEG